MVKDIVEAVVRKGKNGRKKLYFERERNLDKMKSADTLWEVHGLVRRVMGVSDADILEVTWLEGFSYWTPDGDEYQIIPRSEAAYDTLKELLQAGKVRGAWKIDELDGMHLRWVCKHDEAKEIIAELQSLGYDVVYSEDGV